MLGDPSVATVGLDSWVLWLGVWPGVDGARTLEKGQDVPVKHVGLTSYAHWQERLK